MKHLQSASGGKSHLRKRRGGTTLLLLLAIILSLMEVLWSGALWYEHQDMLHELRRDSQWVEGAVNGYYAMLEFLIVHTEAFAAAWWLWIRILRKRKGLIREKKSNPHGKLCLALTVVAILCALAAHSAHVSFVARRPNIDGGLGYFLRDVRRPQLAAAFAIQVWLICALRWAILTVKNFLEKREEYAE